MQLFLRNKLRRSPQAFSLVEMLLVATIMTVVIFGLYAMFDQTQKALLGNTTQVDVLESGRAAMDLICREIEQSRVSQLPNTVNFMAYNTFPRVGYPNAVALSLITNPAAQYNVKWTNVLQDVFFLTQKQGDEWYGCGYCVGTNVIGAMTNPNPSSVWRATNGWGQLYFYSFCTSAGPSRQGTMRLNGLFVSNAIYCFTVLQNVNETPNRWSNAVFSPIIDGVVHFAVKTCDGAGRLISDWGQSESVYDWSEAYLSSLWCDASLKTNYLVRLLDWNDAEPLSYWPYNVAIRQEQLIPSQSKVRFLSNAMPAYIELELALIEPKLLTRLNGISRADRQREYLEQHPGQVHLFRKRIPIRTATP